MGHIAPLSFKVLTTLTAYRIVAADTSAANTVTYPANASRLPLGITADDAKDTTTGIPVYGPGNIAKLYFNDTVAAGAYVASDSSGRGVPHVDVTAGSAIVGVLVGPAVAATGTIAHVMILPSFKAIP
jgi:hypothetical protein